nr:RNA-directed DNA polymerase, eukaryota, nucleotide-binding alpha-beta plait domain protein [Tanacetum cinerariifolium]
MGDGNWKSYRSKKDQTQSISQSIFVTNLPDHVTAHDLWKVCNDYGIIVDAFIPYKKSKAENVNLLLLLTPLMLTREIHQVLMSLLLNRANRNVMSDQVLPYLILDYSCISDRDFSFSLIALDGDDDDDDVLDVFSFGAKEVEFWVKKGFSTHVSAGSGSGVSGAGSWFSSLKPACNSFVSDERVVWISLEGLPLKVWTHNIFAKVALKWDDLVEWEELDEKSLFCSLYWVRAKEMEAWDPFICNDYESESSDDEEDAKDDGSCVILKGLLLKLEMKDARTINLKDEVEKLIGSGSGFVDVEIPFTPRAKHHNYIGSEHLMLGSLREDEGVAARVLKNLGADQATFLFVKASECRIEVPGMLEANFFSVPFSREKNVRGSFTSKFLKACIACGECSSQVQEENLLRVNMDDPNITMKEYIRLEEEKARRNGKVYNWETDTYGKIWLEEEKARRNGKVYNWETDTYGKIWYDEDVHDLRSVEPNSQL